MRLLEALADDPTPVVSWSTVTQPVLVTGRSARPAPLNPATLERLGIVREARRSGGGPVLWDTDLLSLDVVVPQGHPLAGHDVTAAYRWLGEAVTAALCDIGAPAHVVSLAAARAAQARDDDAARLAARTCFGGLSPFEVVADDGRKLVGLSQARRRVGTLFQCGIAMRFDHATLAEVVEPEPTTRAALEQALRAACAGLDEYGVSTTVAALVEACEPRLAAAIRAHPAP